MLNDIKKEILINIINKDLNAIRNNLIILKNNGYTSDDAYRLISYLREYFSDCPEEDFILDILDICSNFCVPPFQVWS